MYYKVSFFFSNLLPEQRKSLAYMLLSHCKPVCLIPNGETACDACFNSYHAAITARAMVLQEFPYVTPSEIVTLEKFILLAEA